jgi:DHA3 family macrolide efflux protein-like MFS transporter
MMNWKKTFAIIWTGQLFSLLSSTIVSFAVILWLSLETGSAEVLALAAIFALLPQSILGLFSGVFIDRWSRKKIMILADIFIALCTLILALIFYLGEATTWQIYLLLSLRSAGTAFHTPAMQAAVPTLAPESQLMRIAGINQSIQSVCNIAGPALAALFISVMDMAWVLMLDVAGALIACGSLALITIPNPAKSNPEAKTGILFEMKEGFRAISSNPGIVWLFVFSILATFFIMPISVLFPLMTLNHFSGNAYQMSFVEVAWGVGMLLGGAFLGIQKLKIRNIILLNLMFLVLGGSFLFSGMLPSTGFAGFMVFTFIGGISGAIYFSSFTVILQTQIDSGLLGRVFSVYMSLAILPSMLGLLGTGSIADSIGVTNAFIIGGLVISMIGIISFLTPAVMKLEKTE